MPSILVYILKHRISHEMPTFSLFFFFGVLLSVLKNNGFFERIKNKIPSIVSWLMLLVLIITLEGAKKLFGINDIKPLKNIYALILIVIFFALVISKPSDFFVLRFKPMIFIGEISYGFYLIHRPLMKIIGTFHWHPALTIFASLLFTIVSAYLMYKFIESPAKKFIATRF
jgi:peptidoglycan/LPS O-acetylase OafA/YrhL